MREAVYRAGRRSGKRPRNRSVRGSVGVPGGPDVPGGVDGPRRVGLGPDRAASAAASSSANSAAVSGAARSGDGLAGGLVEHGSHGRRLAPSLPSAR